MMPIDGMAPLERSDVVPAVACRGVSKQFGTTQALHSVDLDIAPGTVHALVGENGAGKSTCLGILAGRVAPTRGKVRLFGKPIAYGDPRGCRRAGIAAIYQELTIVPALSAQANVFLGTPIARRGVLAEKQMRARYAGLRDRLGAGPPPDATARDLAVADQQLIEIMRALATDARVILFDEPTASLALHERRALRSLIRSLRDDGVTTVFVSHNLDEVLELADQVTVFRDGRLRASKPAAEWTKAGLVDAMLGRAADSRVGEALRTGHHPGSGRPSVPRGEPLLEVARLTVPGVLRDVDITVGAGEVVGIGGLVGSGRTTLLRSLAGLEPHATGEIRLRGRVLPVPRSVRKARRAGVALLPEDRKRQGLVPQLSAADNVVLADMAAVSRLGVLSGRLRRTAAATALHGFRFRTDRLGEPARNLSGGNQQKLLLGRWRHSPPSVLLVDEPTRGIDIGAKEEILAALEQMAAQGIGVVMVSSELEEVAAVSHRVYVLSEGRCAAELDGAAAPITTDAILAAAFRIGA